MYNLNNLKLLWEQQIKNEYIKYQKFIENTNMPKYKVNFVDGTKNSIGYSMQTFTYTKPIVLNINTGFMIKGNKHCQPVLFHEFTHMFDSKNLFNNKPEEEKTKVLSLYTEYHASQIEFLRFMEFESIETKKNIKSSDIFMCFDNQYSVFEYYNNKCKLLFESIKKYNKYKTIESYKTVINSYFYVFGLKSIYDKHIENVEMPLYSECIFNNLIIPFYKLLQNYNVDDLWDMFLKLKYILDKTYTLDVLKSN